VPKRILVPLDGTPVGEAILPHVAEIARPLKAEIELLHVVPPRFVKQSTPRKAAAPSGMMGAPALLPTLSPSSTVLDNYHFDPGEVAATRRYVERVTEWLRSEGLQVSCAVVESPDVADAVLRRAREFDFLALSATVVEKGSRLGRIVYGSISERLLHEAQTPIIFVRVPHAAG
jgi:nucleotide-binding universal stress UspA family protein